MILVNGSQGVGTGFSTFIPCYNPIDIVNYLLNKIDGKETGQLNPWYRGFTGDIVAQGSDSYLSKGKYKIINYKTIEITELPIGTWTDSYKEFLEDLIDDKKKKDDKDKDKHKESIIVDYKSYCTESTVSFHLEFKPNILKEIMKDGKLEKELKLSSKFSTTNMHLFNRHNQIQKYTVDDIMNEFYVLRYEYYQRRKEHLLNTLEQILKVLNEKVRFINDVINEQIIINKRSKDNINQQLEDKEYLKVDDDYNYLVKMPIYNLSLEKKEELENEAAKKNEEFEQLQGTSIESMWKSELQLFLKKYNEFLASKLDKDDGDGIKIKKKRSKK